jgi:glycosyltransferase involved in cell wall biosynthesis
MGGGAGNATANTARSLVEKGHSVHVLTSALRGQLAMEALDGVVVWRVRSLRRSILECGLVGAATYLFFALFKLRRLAAANNYDIYQFYFSLPTGLLALYVHLVLRKPYVLALRGSDVPGYDESAWFMAPLHCLLRPLTRYLWRHAKSVTVISRQLGGLARETLPALDVRVIPNGIDTKCFPRKTETEPRGNIRLITVCRMVQRKGLEFLIEAMRELRDDDIELWLIGSGPLHGQVQRLVREHEVADCVWMPGYVPREKLASYYGQADIFVLPSLSESFGQVLLEAMSTGLPIVATTVGGIPEVVENQRGGLLIPPKSSEAIVAAVRSLIAFPQRMSRMGEHNADRARQRYRWDLVASAYEDLYYRVLHETVGRRSQCV